MAKPTMETMISETVSSQPTICSRRSARVRIRNAPKSSANTTNGSISMRLTAPSTLRGRNMSSHLLAASSVVFVSLAAAVACNLAASPPNEDSSSARTLGSKPAPG